MTETTGKEATRAAAGEDRLPVGACCVSEDSGADRRFVLRKRLWKWVRAAASEMKNQLLLDE